MIIDSVNYTGVSMEVFVTIEMIKGTREGVTDKYFARSVANIIAKSGLTPEENEQVFDLTSIPQDQRIEILEKVKSIVKEEGEFDLYYFTLLGDRKFVKTVISEEIASDICLKSNQTLTPLQMRVGMGNMFYIKKEQKMKVILRCPECGKIINETEELDSEAEAKKLYEDALVNPLTGWCKDCDRKPIPEII